MRVRALLFAALCSVLGALACGSVAGAAPPLQQPTGTIRGTVMNTAGSALSAVSIEASGASGAVYRSITDRNGAFVLDGVPPDLYSVSAVGPTVKRAVVEGVRVNAGRSAVIDFQLAPQAAAEPSRATYLPGLAASSLDDTTVFPDDVIDHLPKGRDALSLVPMVPGISVDTIYTGLSFRGASARETRYFIDGLDVTNIFSGGAAVTLPTDVVQELHVRSGGFEAAMPAATGALAGIVTPVGGRRWSGTAALHFTNDSLSGDEATRGWSDAFSTWEPALTAGGPLFGDWLTLFASYAPRFTSATRTMDVIDVQGNRVSASFSNAERTQLSTDSLTGRLRGSGRFRISGVFGRARREGTLPPASAGPVTTGFDWSALTRSRPFGAFSGTIDAMASSRFTLSFLFGYSRTDVIDYGVPEIVYRTANAPGPSTPPDVAAALNEVRSASAPIPTNAATDRDRQQRATARGSVGFGLAALGRHDVKAGGQFDYVTNDVLSGSFGPVVDINASNPSSPYGTYDISSWLLSGSADTTGVALFAEDTWRPTSRLTIRGGVRAERQIIPSYATTIPDPATGGRTVISIRDITLGFGDAISPRIGAAFDVRGDGKWLVSGTWGITHDPVQLDMARYYLGADVRYQGTYTLDTLDFSTIGYVGCLNPKQCNILYPGTLVSSAFYAPLASVGSALKPSSGQDFSVGIDHGLGSTATVGGRYIRRRLTRAFEDVGYFASTTSTTPSLRLATAGDAPLSSGVGLPDLPTPRRTYDGAEARLTKRFSDGWEFAATYTYSRLTGNYTAFFTPGSTDVPPAYPPLTEDPWSYTGAYNSPYSMFDSRGAPVYGPLDLDRPHVLKAQALARLPLQLSAGVYQVVASGAPISRVVLVGTQPVYYAGRLTDGRTPTYSQTDVQVQREFRAGTRIRAVFGVNVLNLFDQSAAVAVDALEGTLPPLPASQFFAGFDAGAAMTKNPTFLQPARWQPGRRIRVDARVVF